MVRQQPPQHIIDQIKELIGYYHLDEVIFDYHGYDYPEPETDQSIGIEIESYNGYIEEVLFAQYHGILILPDDNGDICNNYTDAYWYGTYDSTVGIEFVSKPIEVDNLQFAISELYSNLSIETGDQTGTHYHINKEMIHDPHLLGILIVILSNELFAVSGRNWSSWNNWSSCRTKSIETFDDAIHHYFNEQIHYGHGLYRPHTSTNETVEYRGFITTENPNICLKRINLLLELVKASNILSYFYSSSDIETDFILGQLTDLRPAFIKTIAKETEFFTLLSELKKAL